MTKVLVTQSKLDDLALHISAKSGEPMPLTIQEMQDAVDGIQTGGSTPTGNIDITQAGVTDVTDYATATVPVAEQYIGVGKGYFTENNVLKWRVRGFAQVDLSEGDQEGWVSEGTQYSNYSVHKAVPSGTTVTPSTSSQTIGGQNYMMEDAVTVAAMPSGSVSASATKGSVSNHAISVTPTATVGTAGYLAAGSTNGTAVSVSASELVSGTVTISASGNTDVTNYATASVAAGGATASASKSISGHTATVTPSVTRTAGYVTAGSENGTAVTVSASELVSGNLAITENGTNIDVANYATCSVNVSGGGSSTVATATATASGRPTSLAFTVSGEPIAFFCRCTSSMSRSSNSTYYYVADMRYNGTNTTGNCWRMSNGNWTNITSGYSFTYSNGTLTLSSNGTSTSSPGSFYNNGSYELVYVY